MSKEQESDVSGLVEISLDELLRYVEPFDHPIFAPKLTSLPLDQLSWESFESLCARLLETTDVRISQAFRYGGPGYLQQGIDILATMRLTKRKIVVQCKRVKNVGVKDIHSWIDSFLLRKDLDEIEQFIVAVAHDIGDKPALVDAWSLVTQKLADKKIEAVLWDVPRLNNLLRQRDKIVSVYFGEDVAEKFCSKISIPRQYPIAFRPTYKSLLDGHLVLENKSVQLEMFLPTKNAVRVSSGFSFARADLSGISFSVPGETIIEWLQWRAHHDLYSDCPFLYPSLESDRYVLMASSVRLTLEKSEVEELDWVLQEAWSEYIRYAEDIEKVWRTLRFPRLHNVTDDFVVGLFRVKRWFWRMVLQFAMDHDYGKGVSDLHIFDGAPGVLKVYVSESRAGLSPGYHLIAYGYQEGGITLPWEEGVIIGWQPLIGLNGKSEVISPSEAFDAEYAHEWFQTILFPSVLTWLEKKQKIGFWEYLNNFGGSKTNLRGRDSVFDIAEYVVSLADTKYRIVGFRIVHLAEVREVIEILQQHYHAYCRSAFIEIEQIVTILRLTVRLMKYASKLDEYYIRSKLPLGNGDLLDELRLLSIASDKVVGTPGWLDHSLRVLKAVVDEIEELSPSELDTVSNFLEPVWGRYIEDRTCEQFI